MPTTVFFATNRKRTHDGSKAADYAGEFGPAGLPGKITHATAFIDGTDTDLLKAGRITYMQHAAPDAFDEAVAADLTSQSNLIIFLHGFANGFTDALTRAAFNREWLGGNASMVAFSWPSGGVIVNGGAVLPGLLVAPLSLLLLAAGKVESPLASAYLADQKAARASAGDVVGFLDRLRPAAKLIRQKGGRVILLAHSMGNLVLQSALENWANLGLPDDMLFDEAISAAADTDHGTATAGPDWLQYLGKVSGRVSLYHSRKDSILHLSRGVNGVKRLGDSGPVDMDVAGRYPISRFRFIDCSGLADSGPDPSLDMRHQYYRRIPAVRDDIRRVIKGTGAAGQVIL